MPKTLNELAQRKYTKFTHAERIDIIYGNRVHMIPMRKLARLNGLSYNSVKNIIDAYKLTGRTNRKN